MAEKSGDLTNKNVAAAAESLGSRSLGEEQMEPSGTQRSQMSLGLFSSQTITITAGERCVVDTCFESPLKEFSGQIVNSAALTGSEKGLYIDVKPVVVENVKGDVIKVVLINQGKNDYEVCEGDAIATLLLHNQSAQVAHESDVTIDEEEKARLQLPPVLQDASLSDGLSFGHQGDRPDFEATKPRHGYDCTGPLMTWEEWSETQQYTSPPVMYVSRRPVKVTDGSWKERLARWKSEEKGRDERLLNKAEMYGNRETRHRCITKAREVLDHQPSVGGVRKALDAAKKASYAPPDVRNSMISLLESWLADHGHRGEKRARVSQH